MLIAIAAILFIEEMAFGLWESIDMAISLVGMVALFGLAFNKAIGSRVFWQYFFYAYLLITIAFSLLFPLLGIKLYGQVLEFNGEYAFGLVIALISVWAAYLYGFKRTQLWNTPSN